MFSDNSVQPDDIEQLKFASTIKKKLTPIIHNNNIKTVMFTESFLEGSLWKPVQNCKMLLRIACPKYLFNSIGLSKAPVNKYFKLIEQQMLSNADCCYAPTNKMARLAADYFNIPTNSINVIANPIDTEVFTPKKVNKTTNPKICFAGRYTKEKGAEIINAIIPNLMLEFPNLTFSIAGSSGYDHNGNSYINILKQLLSENKTLKRFQHFEFIQNSQMANFYQQHNILLYPSLFDSFSMVIAEAQACGLAIVSSDAGGIPEVVIDKVTGFTVQVNNIQKTRQLLIKLIKNNVLRNKMSINARKHQVELSSFENVYKKFKENLTEYF